MANEPPPSCHICGLALSPRMKRTPVGRTTWGEDLLACRKCAPKVEAWLAEHGGDRRPDVLAAMREGAR